MSREPMSLHSTRPSPADPDPDVADLADLCAAFGAALGLDGPAPRRTLEAALSDDAYAGNLLASRRHPKLLRNLVDAPPRTSRRGAGTGLSGLALARTAAVALARWAGAGFSTVDEAARGRRAAACLACPHRLPPAAEGLGRCGLCGCPLGRKIRMTSETCPGDHPSRPGETRWGDPVTPSG